MYNISEKHSHVKSNRCREISQMAFADVRSLSEKLR